MIRRVLVAAALAISVVASWVWFTQPSREMAHASEPVVMTATPTSAPFTNDSLPPSTETPTSSATATPTANVVAPSTPIPIPSGALDLETLRITVPRLGIDLPLAYGDVERDVPRPGYAGDTPERVALVFPGSAPLRSGGNTYIYAHARVGMFLALWGARVDDEVDIYVARTPAMRLTYRVTRVLPRVDPNDTSWLDPAGPEHLTLQTSTGPYPTDPRFIVVAVPVSP